MTRVGYVGLGQMGAAMAGWLVSTGAEVTVYDIDDTATEALVAQGAQRGASAADVAARSDVVSICVPAAHHVDAVLTGPEGIRDAGVNDQVILVHSTIAPESVTRAAAVASEWGAAVHDACIFGGVASAVKGELVVFAGGVSDLRDDAREVLHTYGSLVLDCGPVGAGAALKIAANVMTYSQFMAASTAYEIARSAGADPQRVIEAWRHVGQLGVLTERFLPVLGMAPGTMPESLRALMSSSTAIAEKDLELAAALLDGDGSLHGTITALTRAMADVYGVGRSPSHAPTDEEDR